MEEAVISFCHVDLEIDNFYGQCTYDIDTQGCRMQSKEARIKFLRRRDNELGRRINIHKRDLKGDLHELTRSSIQQSLRGDQDERASVKCEIASLEKKHLRRRKKTLKKLLIVVL